MVYGYARVSTKTQAKDGNSLEAQEMRGTAGPAELRRQFSYCPRSAKSENVMITEVDGQTSVAYIGTPIDEAIIQAVWARDGINAYNAVLRGNAFLQEDLNLIDHNGIYQDDPIAVHLISVEADTDPLLSSAFQKERVKLTGGELSGESGAIISEALANENGLRVGDEIQLSPRESHMGTAILVLLLSTVLSSLGAMRLSPKEILSKLS